MPRTSGAQRTAYKQALNSGVFVGVLVVAYAVGCAVSDTGHEFIDVCAY